MIQDATQVNDFRRVGILKNPNGCSAGSIATAKTTIALIVSGTIGTNYQADELITQATTGAFKVVLLSLMQLTKFCTGKKSTLHMDLTLTRT